MTAGTTRVGIVLPVYNRRETTLRALRSLSDADKTGMTLHVVVVDDGSSDGTAEAIRHAHPDVDIVTGDGSLFYAGGTNAGLRRLLEVGIDYAVIANDDAVFSRQVFVELLKCAHQFPHSVVGALLLLWDTPHRVFQVGQVWDTWYGGWRMPYQLTAFTVPPEPWEVEALVGNCTLVPAAALQSLGLLDDVRFPQLWADVEFTTRLRRGGWRLLLAPRARVFCQPNTYPPSLGSGSLRAAANALFANPLHPMNLSGHWRMRWYSAPSRLRGLAASVVYTVRLIQRGLRLGHWPQWPDPPLGPRTLSSR